MAGEVAEEQGIPAEEAFTLEEVDERALALFRTVVGDALAGLSGFFTKEERRKIYTEEESRIFEQHPEGVPSGVLIEAVIQRM